jgi:hypothetical protein
MKHRQTIKEIVRTIILEKVAGSKVVPTTKKMIKSVKMYSNNQKKESDVFRQSS